MNQEAPLLSIVTGTRNRPNFIAAMVKSVLAHTSHSFELLIGDASDSEIFSNGDPRVRVLPEEVPLNFVRGYNRAFQEARGQFVCWLNDDLEVLPGWSTAVFEVFERHREVDLACLPLVEPDEPDPFIMLYHQLPYAQMGVIRKEVGDALGWFDERYCMYGSDPDLSMRLIESGGRLAPVFGRILHHVKAEDTQRKGNHEQSEQDNALLGKTWRRRRYDLCQKYKRNCFPYFEGLSTHRSATYECTLLDIPETADARPIRPQRPHRVRPPRFRHWLGLR